MMPDMRFILLIVLIVSCHPWLHGMKIHGQTKTGMRFEGEVIALRDGILEVTSSRQTGIHPVGIPLPSIKSVQIDIPVRLDSIDTGKLENLHPLLPYCDGETLAGILDWVRTLGEAGDWPGAYLWAGRLADTGTSPEIEVAAKLVEAEALLEMGLYQQLAAKLASLNISIEPINAPPLLCWLNERLTEQEGNMDQARFWAELPALQIPSKARKGR
jgi:hypothetical protein